MGCIKTYSGVMIDPLNPNMDEIIIDDIAHALSMLCRANGHFRSFYSVGQHSINCMQEAKAQGYSRKIQLACLLHDASEAYLSDVTRPVKAELPKYREIEIPLQNLIWNKWLTEPLTDEEECIVFQIDDAILAHEFLALMDTRFGDAIPRLASVPQFEFMGFVECEREFLRLFYSLTKEERSYFTVGIDWMKPYWLATEMRGDEVTLHRYVNIGDACDAYAHADAVFIDIPIGLPENREEDMLRPDKAARAVLPSKRKSTIFPVPCRQAVYAESEADAKRLNADILGRNMSRQAFGFTKMIRQVDAYLQQNPAWKNRLLESHPEIAFQILNDGAGLLHSKHSDEGVEERIRILLKHGIDPTPLFAGVTEKQREDVLDALCLALSAQLGCRNEFHTIPQHPAKDRTGIHMQMCFGNNMNEIK